MNRSPARMNRPHSTDRSFYRYCPLCGNRLARKQVGTTVHPTCPSCGFVQYRNPVVGVAGVISEKDAARIAGNETILAVTGRPAVRGSGLRVLLARRRTTYPGLYCLPCGYVEFDEEIREALVREVKEETGLIVEPGEIVAVHSNFHDPDRQSVGIWFRAHPVGGTLRPGDDVDALLFAPATDPGVQLAFPTDRIVLADLPS